MKQWWTILGSLRFYLIFNDVSLCGFELVSAVPAET